MTTTTEVTATCGAEPINIFLTPRELMVRKRWGRTKGYARMRQADFPPLLDGAYRLDTIIEWENRQLEAAGWAPERSGTASPALASTSAPMLPAKRKAGRPRKDAA